MNPRAFAYSVIILIAFWSIPYYTNIHPEIFIPLGLFLAVAVYVLVSRQKILVVRKGKR